MPCRQQKLQEQFPVRYCYNVSITAYSNLQIIVQDINTDRRETYLYGSLEGLLNIQPLAHYCLVQLPFKSQEIHISLRLWDQFPDLCV